MEKLPCKIPKILIPKGFSNKDFQNWVTIACDIYTGNLPYWEVLEKERRELNSTLWMTLPEVYLPQMSGEDELTEEDKIKMSKIDRISIINKKMREMCEPKKDFFEEINNMVYVERDVQEKIGGKVHKTKRRGILMNLELEKYSYLDNVKTPISPSEQTIPSRIPPRLLIREDAMLELPHILVLIDDKEETVIGHVGKTVARDEKELYNFDFEVKGNPTHLAGYRIDGDLEKDVEKALLNLQKKQPILFLMGDGNHSFATAWKHWLKLKETLSPEEQKTHPAQYCMVEVINLYDESIAEFHPIHRLLQKVIPEQVLGFIAGYFKDCEIKHFTWDKKGIEAVEKREKEAAKSEEEQFFRFMFTASPTNFSSYEANGNRIGYVIVKEGKELLEVSTLQKALDVYMEKFKVHGDDLCFFHDMCDVENAAKRSNTIGFELPNVEKSKLFQSVVEKGKVPRKTFSIGQAHDKRVYLEARKIA